MKTKVKIGIALVAISLGVVICNFRSNLPAKWSIVTDEVGAYGYVNFDRRVYNGTEYYGQPFHTCEEAKAARDEAKKWSDDFDAGRLPKREKPGVPLTEKFKPAECK